MVVLIDHTNYMNKQAEQGSMQAMAGNRANIDAIKRHKQKIKKRLVLKKRLPDNVTRFYRLMFVSYSSYSFVYG